MWQKRFCTVMRTAPVSYTHLTKTTDVTIKVETSIEELKKESEIINEFVEKITDI